MRDAFKPAIKRLRDGCDVARRVEESMVASAALGHAAILEEQSNLIQVQSRTISHDVPVTCAVIAPCPLPLPRNLFTIFICRRSACMHTRAQRWSLCIA